MDSMSEPGKQNAKSIHQNFHYDHEAHDNDYSRQSNNREVESCPHKEESKNVTSELCHGVGMLLHDTTSCGLANRRSMTHWWEAPEGFRSRGRSKNQLDSPTHSDLTFESATMANNHRNDASDIAQINSVTLTKSSASVCGERTYDCSNASVSLRMESPRSVMGRHIDGENMVMHQDTSCLKDRASRWTDKNGKMLIQSDVFDAILPSADEVGLQWRISELRIALRASESARMESELETEALRKYLAEVEAAAAGLQSRVQELEHLITISAKDECRELEQLRAKIVMEVSKEARMQTARAAKSVAAAREATMELDKVKRHASSVIKAQEEESERLRMEVAECRTLYHARAGQLQEMKEKIEQLELNIKTSSNSNNDALKSSENEIMMLQKSLDEAKTECREKSKKLANTLEAFETQLKTLQSSEERLKNLEREKTELANHKQQLEQQIADLQNQRMASAAADYDHELRKVRAMLGAEKQHLLTELAMLRHGNQNLQVELVEWQEKFHSLSQQMCLPSDPQSTSRNSVNSMHTGGQKDFQANDIIRHSHNGLDSCELYVKGRAEEGVEGHECMTPTTETVRSMSLCSCHKTRSKQSIDDFDGHYSSQSKESGRKLRGLRQQQQRIQRRKNNDQSCNLLKDDLLAAAHREIVKLKEINQCLMDARQRRMWHGNDQSEKENFSQI